MRLPVLMVLVLLPGHNQTAPVRPPQVAAEQPLPLLALQMQVDQTTSSTPSAPDTGQRKTSSSSSSSSSSSVSSESNESSEGNQMLRERLNLENMAVEHLDSSQESSEFFHFPSNSSSPLWLSGLAAQADTSQGREGDTRDDSTEPHHRAVPLTFDPLLIRSRPQLTTSRDPGGVESGVRAEGGGARGAEPDRGHLHMEPAGGLTFDLPGHRAGHHGNTAGLELVL